MNANELADLLETTESTNNKAAAMLRKQHLEIMELKNSRDYWCLQYKDVFNKLEDVSEELMSLENSIRFEDGYGHN